MSNIFIYEPIKTELLISKFSLVDIENLHMYTYNIEQ